MKRHVACMNSISRQRGFLLVTAVVLIVIVAVILTVMLFLGATGNDSSVVHSQSGQALFVAESGLEYERRRLAQNVDWYRATTDPFDGVTNNFGQGSFTVATSLSATELRTRMNAGSGAITANVFAGGTGNRWPATGTLMIDEDMNGGAAEFVTYSSTNANTFSVTARNQSVNGVLNLTSPAGTGLAHVRGDRVYPVTTLGAALSNTSCQAIPNPFTVADNSKLLATGTITVFHYNGATIDTEQISYSGYTVSGGTRTLLGVQRCQNGTTQITASAGDPVVSFVANTGGVDDFEVEVVSTGNVSSTQRVLHKTVRR